MGRIWRLDTETGTYAVKELYWASEPSSQEAVVARQVAFCEQARAAGVAAPANLPTKSGPYLFSLPEEFGGGLIRAYEWIDGRGMTAADSAGPSWAARTLALIEGLGVPPGDQEVDPWFYRAPTAEEWAALADRCKAAGQPWTDALRRAIPGLLAVGEWAQPHDPDELIVAHTDFQRQNVLVDRTGRYVLLDWDDAGPSAPARSLGRLVLAWHRGDGNTIDHEGIGRTVRTYRDAGGRAELSDVTDLSDSIGGYLNYVYTQAGLSLDRTAPAAMSAEASRAMPGLLDDPPQIAKLAEVVRAANLH